jgi:hypothetical protein
MGTAEQQQQQQPQQQQQQQQQQQPPLPSPTSTPPAPPTDPLITLPPPPAPKLYSDATSQTDSYGPPKAAAAAAAAAAAGTEREFEDMAAAVQHIMQQRQALQVRRLHAMHKRCCDGVGFTSAASGAGQRAEGQREDAGGQPQAGRMHSTCHSTWCAA